MDMKQLLTVLLLLNCSMALPAHTPVRQAAKALVTHPSVHTVTLPRYAGVRGSMMGINFYLQRILSTQNISVVTKNRSWLEQQKRNWKARQLHKKRQVRDLELQIQTQAQAEREAMLAKLPQINPAHQFTTKDFTNLLPKQISTSQVPLVDEPGVLFRGMALPTDGEAIKNILQNGLRVADAGTQANTRSLAVAGGQPGVSRILAKTPVTNFTSFPTGAVTWANRRVTDNKTLIAIVAVNEQTQAGEIVQLAHDIPPSQIVRFLVPLTIDGKTVWCHIQLDLNGDFLVTPYDISPANP